MIYVSNLETIGWEAAARGCRNPMNSWEKSDSVFGDGWAHLGQADLKLMKNLADAGPDHGKFMRMIIVTCDITAPLYWWKEMDQYKVGTVTDSTSTMHKIHSRPIGEQDFSLDKLNRSNYYMMLELIDHIEAARLRYLETEKKEDWMQIIQMLPSSYNQLRTWQANYAVLRNIYHARKNHKLEEWQDFCSVIETLPYAKELITNEE